MKPARDERPDPTRSFSAAAREPAGSGAWLRLHALKNFQHRRSHIRVVMDQLPCACFPSINIRYAMLQTDRVPGHLELAMLDAKLIGQVSDDLDELVLQSDLPFRRHCGYTVERSADCVPAYFPPADGVHSGYASVMRPAV